MPHILKFPEGKELNGSCCYEATCSVCNTGLGYYPTEMKRTGRDMWQDIFGYIRCSNCSAKIVVHPLGRPGKERHDLETSIRIKVQQEQRDREIERDKLRLNPLNTPLIGAICSDPNRPCYSWRSIEKEIFAPKRWRCGVKFRLGSFWIGWHYSKHNERLCVNLLPFVTFWITKPGGITP